MAVSITIDRWKKLVARVAGLEKSVALLKSKLTAKPVKGGKPKDDDDDPDDDDPDDGDDDEPEPEGSDWDLP